MNREDNIDRIPVPKWKALDQTPTSELTSAKGMKPDHSIASGRAERAYALYERWRASPSLNNALELLDSSLFTEDLGLFSDAASQVLSNQSSTRASRMVAQSILDPRAFHQSRRRAESCSTDVFQKIASNKNELRQNMRNALLHTEQARLYTVIGELDAAEKSFALALGIAPNNRHVLRSYSRFMFHAGEAEIARKRLLRTSSIKHDPWLQAAEIALSEVSGVGSNTAAIATSAMNQDRLPLEHRSELASALATLEYASGNRKKFKKRLGESLLKPTDNALAQVMWYARESTSDMEIDETYEPAVLLALRRSREALTYSYLQAKKWKEAVSSFRSWQSEEQFSSHIAVQGSYYAVAFAADHRAAVELCKNAQSANKDSAMLFNNLCVAHRRLGEVEDAEAALASLKSAARNWREDPTYLATDATVQFARQSPELARSNYIKALEICSDRSDTTLRERVKMHWIWDEVLSGHVDFQAKQRIIDNFESKGEFQGLNDETKLYWSVMKDEIVLADHPSVTESSGLQHLESNL